ncbi:MAG: hypothetical protein GW795_06490 [Cyanobacteria bacterium]|uniref:protein phosphatase 2C domain-containing protein n=1 Tax=Geminocystis herdmanii TaxID=669359 RepID=UPI0003476240|nr:protein phosphatase 2C domain-containing protein [Geminocystis herdmanii]NCO74551.1 hypothetical protein [Cyanobacteria bacterium CG_2015-16_32_12]NCQ05287.1 hypothetical protein [Cyanobacteria bacterium CG_2015-09_32_10]NCQ41531.1 hypothetical protein [Cyanobacteria bacterium CG_2015-04_32_10]NCS85862.1 hypothetical protein [Cyanobacteria bacterium CG_2015-02_32_10]
MYEQKKENKTDNIPLIVHLEIADNKGEDTHFFIDQEIISLGVLDGLGGKSAGFDGKTGGQIASNLACEIAREKLAELNSELTQEKAIFIQQNICQILEENAREKIKSRIKGSLSHKLCTTIAIANFPRTTLNQDIFCINLSWIGDSRIYFLSPNIGLQQLTKDDLTEEQDAFDLIYKDSPMSKYLTANTQPDWTINFKQQTFKEKGMLIICTDGCFQYLNTPWDFEKLILDTLTDCESLQDWETLLTKKYDEQKQDDISLIIYPLGYQWQDFNKIKSEYIHRRDFLIANFYKDNSQNNNELIQFWKEYKKNYEEYLTEKKQEKIFQNIQEVNNVDSKNNVIKCPKCGEIEDFSKEEIKQSRKITRKGKTKSGEQKYKCKGCGKNFQYSTSAKLD